MSTNTNTGLASHARWYYYHYSVVLIVLLMVGMAWRLQNVASWPIPFHPMLQYENALNTRALWYQWKGASATEAEKTWLAGYSGRWKGLPITESLTACLYLKLDYELPFFAVAIQGMMFMLMVFLFFDITRRYLHSWFGATSACAFLLLHSFLVAVNRSFQHETVALLGFITAWWFIARSRRMPTVGLGLLGGFLLLIKPGIYWIPWCALLIGYSVERHGWKASLKNPHLVPSMFLGLLPGLLWMKFILTTNETHQWKWQLLFTSEWYVATGLQLGAVLGWVPLGLTAMFIVFSCYQRKMLPVCIALGCLVNSLLFSYASMTHDYYLVPFFPLAALACGKFAVLIKGFAQRHRQTSTPGQRSHRSYSISQLLFYTQLLICFCVYLLLTTNLGYYWPGFGNYYGDLQKHAEYRPLEATCIQLGEKLGNGTQVIALTNDYAMPLRYFSGLHAEWWPTAGDLWYEGLGGSRVIPAEERLQQLMQRTRARYFIITLNDELAQQADLHQLLQQCVELPASIDGVRIFDLSQRR